MRRSRITIDQAQRQYDDQLKALESDIRQGIGLVERLLGHGQPKGGVVLDELTAINRTLQSCQLERDRILQYQSLLAGCHKN